MYYYKYYVQKIMKDKKILFSFVLFFLIGLLFFLLNHSEKNKSNFIANTNLELKQMKDTLKQYNGIFTQDEEQPFLSEKDRKEGEEAIKSISEAIEKADLSINYYQQKQWQKALTLELERLEYIQRMGREAKGGEFADENLLYQMTLTAKLAEMDIEPDNENLEYQGFTFILSWMQNLFPMFYSLILCFFLAYLFTSQYHKKLDLEILYPESATKLLNKRLLLTTLVCIGFYLTILILLFVIIYFVSDAGSPYYPIVIKNNHEIITRTVYELLVESLMLEILSMVFIVNLVSLISQLTKQLVMTLFISILSINGVLLVTTNFVPFYPLIHLLPTTYLASVSVIKNELLDKTANRAVNYSQGLLVLLFWILLLFCLNLFLAWKGERKQLWRCEKSQS